MPRAKIEQKHIYNNTSQIINGIFRADTNISNQVNPNIVYVARPNYPIQGVEDNQRIGRKITSTSLVIEGFINLFNFSPASTEDPSLYEVFNEYITDSSQTEPLVRETVNFLCATIRQFVVEVDTEFVLGLTDEQIKRKFLSWFHDLVIYTDNGTQVSNQTFVKRESTSYTGQFRILHDTHYTLSQKRPSVHFQLNIKYQRDLNFDGTGASLPTNKVVYLLTFGPTNVRRDYINYGFSQYLVNNVNDLGTADKNFYVAQSSSNIKLNYLDI